ncbi:MAG: DUF2911 domain-containing protein [candidate division KSB1 bacterium]|nr:DUF2911 domain-containing protein [candidate division KSB1 bacterium]MDZ7273260.1 DUF2911 domain-containing protein [candidate division KSB1 bacterium]MDZ7285362.1 DUF2911 domain-containing protein [candidate division KSB1 bacterium]MDZ7298394.1 DUF2911 domain-containing protein [candidate division KSB1 bacterium]MDZ7306471.1 DUF2911 domain-containing protein [candidate division KSB1 bacterium]
MKPSLKLARAGLVFALALALAMCSKKEEPQSEAGMSAGQPAAETMAEGDRGTASARFGALQVSIDYGRPQLKGRDMLAQATDGMVWRMGMNEATEITTDADLHFGETVVPRGRYSLWMKKVRDGQWELIFNKKTGIWGHEYPAGEELAMIPMTMSTNPDSVERFTIAVLAHNDTDGTLKAMWGPSVLSVDFTASVPAAP